MVEYISNPYNVRKELEELAKKDNQVFADLLAASSLGIDPATWLRDACIDAFSLIGKSFPESQKHIIPLLEKLSKDAPSPYTIRKAKRALEVIQENN